MGNNNSAAQLFAFTDEDHQPGGGGGQVGGSGASSSSRSPTNSGASSNSSNSGTSLSQQSRKRGKMGNACAGGPSNVLAEEDLTFISSHTALSRQEVDERYEHFLQKHPDGKITKKEFRHMMQVCYPSTDTEKLEKHIFRMYDSNGDGFIDFREFMLVLYILSSGTPEENLKQIFRIFDINNDKSISRKEMDRIVKALFHLLRKEDNPQHESEGALAKMAFKEMDENNDDKITEAEFVKACLSQEKISSMLALRLVDVFI